MNWKDRLRIALPDLLRLDSRTLVGSVLMGGGIQVGAMYYGLNGTDAPYFLLALPAAKLAVWLTDLMNAQRLHEREVERSFKAFREGSSLLRKQIKGFIPSSKPWERRKTPLTPDDQRVLRRIVETVEEIERQYQTSDLLLQRQLLGVLPKIIEQATCALEAGRKLGVLLEFLQNNQLDKLEAEEQQFRQQAEQTPSGPLGSLHSQTSRFKAQQIANVLNAQRDAAIYRAQIYALEAGLSNVRGRIAAMTTIGMEEVGLEMEALDNELATMDEGLRMADRVTQGDYFHAGHYSTGSASWKAQDAKTQNMPPTPSTRAQSGEGG